MKQNERDANKAMCDLAKSLDGGCHSNVHPLNRKDFRKAINDFANLLVEKNKNKSWMDEFGGGSWMEEPSDTLKKLYDLANDLADAKSRGVDFTWRWDGSWMWGISTEQ